MVKNNQTTTKTSLIFPLTKQSIVRADTEVEKLTGECCLSLGKLGTRNWMQVVYLGDYRWHWQRTGKWERKGKALTKATKRSQGILGKQSLGVSVQQASWSCHTLRERVLGYWFISFWLRPAARHGHQFPGTCSLVNWAEGIQPPKKAFK